MKKRKIIFFLFNINYQLVDMQKANFAQQEMQNGQNIEFRFRASFCDVEFTKILINLYKPKSKGLKSNK